MPVNPFLDSSFNIAWSSLAPALVVPAIEEALANAGAAVARIEAQPLEGVDFDSTFGALEAATRPLTVAWGKVSHLQSVMDSAELRDAHNAVLPKVSAFYSRIPLNQALWVRLKAFTEDPASKERSPIQKRLMQETLTDFRQQGADLPANQRERLEAIQTELAQLTQKYSENVLDATNQWELILTDASRLAGLPAHARAAAQQNALSKGHGTSETPAWRFTLHYPSLEPVMTYAEDATLRRAVWEASSVVGAVAPHDNAALVVRILALRDEKAKLLGKAHFADLTLERRMAKTGSRALAFVGEFEHRAAAKFAQETADLVAYKNSKTGGSETVVAPWDLSFWAEKLRQERYDFDEELLRPYFPMEGVITGLFEVARRVFGLVIQEVPGEGWHPEVKLYRMWNAAGVDVGSFYTDWHPRETKRGGAWMNFLITGGPDGKGRRLPHLGLICGNMTPPAPDAPALLTHREVQTIFHEFGHLIHHLLGEVEVPSLNGVNVAWDFVELPSQIMENWCWEPEALDFFARHHRTGEKIPRDLIEKMLKARTFRAASATMRQVAFGKLDLLLHTQAERYVKAGDLEAQLRKDIEACLIPTEPAAPTIVKRFNHLFSDPVGYAAGYYSYKWAEVLDADAFSRFRKEGLFNPTVGAAFVEHILSKGNSEDPAELYRRFMGREPELTALLERSGLAV